MSNENPNSKKPDYLAYNVTNDRDGNGYFNKVGAAWEHKDGKGYDIQLESVPVNGRVTLRTMREQARQHYDEQRAQQPRQPERSYEHER